MHTGSVRSRCRAGSDGPVETGAELYAGREQSKKSQKRIADLERLLGHKEVEIALLKNFLEGP